MSVCDVGRCVHGRVFVDGYSCEWCVLRQLHEAKNQGRDEVRGKIVRGLKSVSEKFPGAERFARMVELRWFEVFS